MTSWEIVFVKKGTVLQGCWFALIHKLINLYLLFNHVVPQLKSSWIAIRYAYLLKRIHIRINLDENYSTNIEFKSGIRHSFDNLASTLSCWVKLIINTTNKILICDIPTICNLLNILHAQKLHSTSQMLSYDLAKLCCNWQKPLK